MKKYTTKKMVYVIATMNDTACSNIDTYIYGYTMDYDKARNMATEFALQNKHMPKYSQQNDGTYVCVKTEWIAHRLPEVKFRHIKICMDDIVDMYVAVSIRMFDSYDIFRINYDIRNDDFSFDITIQTYIDYLEVGSDAPQIMTYLEEHNLSLMTSLKNNKLVAVEFINYLADNQLIGRIDKETNVSMNYILEDNIAAVIYEVECLE